MLTTRSIFTLLRTLQFFVLHLKVQSSKLYDKNYMIASKKITNTVTFALIAVRVFKLLSRKVLFITEKTMETVKK